MLGFSSRVALYGLALSLLTGCTTAEKVIRPDGKIQYQIACGAATGWDVCYRRANELCPQGYTDVEKIAGFNRKELKIQCED